MMIWSVFGTGRSVPEDELLDDVVAVEATHVLSLETPVAPLGKMAEPDPVGLAFELPLVKEYGASDPLARLLFEATLASDGSIHVTTVSAGTVPSHTFKEPMKDKVTS